MTGRRNRTCRTSRNLRTCLGIWFHQSVDDETKFLVYERWTDKTAYVGPHMQTPYMQAFLQKAGSLFAATPSITFWRLNA